MDTNLPTIRDFVLKINEEIQEFHFDNDNIGNLTYEIPKKLRMLADFMLKKSKSNTELHEFIKTHSVEWLNEEAKDLQSLGIGTSEEKRELWLFFSKRWTKEAVSSFIFYCKYFQPLILNEEILASDIIMS